MVDHVFQTRHRDKTTNYNYRGSDRQQTPINWYLINELVDFSSASDHIKSAGEDNSKPHILVSRIPVVQFRSSRSIFSAFFSKMLPLKEMLFVAIWSALIYPMSYAEMFTPSFRDEVRMMCRDVLDGKGKESKRRRERPSGTGHSYCCPLCDSKT